MVVCLKYVETEPLYQVRLETADIIRSHWLMMPAWEVRSYCKLHLLHVKRARERSLGPYPGVIHRLIVES